MSRLSPAQGHLTGADSKGWTLAPTQLKEVRGLHRAPGREEGKFLKRFPQRWQRNDPQL